MLRPRIIPCLLLREGDLVKTVNFKNQKYIGDPINSVRIFNEKAADELIVLDIGATNNGVEPDYKMIELLAAECQMPMCYGGGVKTVEQGKKIIELGVEKVAISSAAVYDPKLIESLAYEIGKQSVAVVLDVKKRNFCNDYDIVTHNALRNSKRSLWDVALEVQKLGAGELIVNCVDLDGVMNGFDVGLAKNLREILNIPITIIGGAGAFSHFSDLLKVCGLVGAAAGSFFVFKGAHRAVLLNYPNFEERESIIQTGMESWDGLR